VGILSARKSDRTKETVGECGKFHLRNKSDAMAAMTCHPRRGDGAIRGARRAARRRSRRQKPAAPAGTDASPIHSSQPTHSRTESGLLEPERSAWVARHC
jgi:hypothetical protein